MDRGSGPVKISSMVQGISDLVAGKLSWNKVVGSEKTTEMYGWDVPVTRQEVTGLHAE